MLSNGLTREVGLKVGPVMLEVFVKHYFDRFKKDTEKDDSGEQLKGDDVLYDEAFTIVKAFMSASTSHTIEELQSFSNVRTPSPPWTHVVRTLVPISCCEEAAPYLIKALGGEEAARRLVGGVKWWQVRGINGVDAQWITAKKDWQEAKKKHKMQREQKVKQDSSESEPPLPDSPKTPHPPPKHDGVYEKDMDAMRCILYLHGGGYYFGSVDQERYSIQRHARKINGRVFAINYRLAPQYPFPCGLQDAIAAYIFLIKPPPGADHVAVDPAHIVIAGDSAGGGLSLALLQVIRDSGLPLPAGGFLISPWCDLTHSFPSIHINTITDVIPESGLSFHKPSILWPPPSPEVSNRVHASLRFRIKQAFKLDEPKAFNQLSTITSEKDIPRSNSPGVDVDPTTPGSTHPVTLPLQGDSERIVIRTDSGEKFEITHQLQFYAQNSLLAHPLVSPAMGYLGGLPPLMIIAGDKEVLRDEIIYTAHRAAYPEKYPISDRARTLYPSLVGVEERFIKPTSVHLQVYDGTPHVLPVLFSFTTPAKFCFRGIASFCKFVTNMTPSPIPMARNAFSTSDVPKVPPVRRRSSLFAGFKTTPARVEPTTAAAATATAPSILPAGIPIIEEPATLVSSSPEPLSPNPSTPELVSAPEKSRLVPGRASIRRTLSEKLSRAISTSRSRSPAARQLSATEEDVSRQQPKVENIAAALKPLINGNGKVNGVADPSTSLASSSDVGGPRFKTNPSLPVDEKVEKYPGEVEVYADIRDQSSWECRMIRERVSTSGVIRPLEPESELDAFQLLPDRVGHLSELTMRRYLRDRAIFDKRFAHTLKSIDKARRHNLERAKEDTIKRLSMLRQTINMDQAQLDGESTEKVSAASSSRLGLRKSIIRSKGKGKKVPEIREAIIASPGWAWAWALDDSECPPPSSIVSRRDTEEARKLAAVADQAIEDEQGQMFSGNNLWSVVINFLTATPGKNSHTLRKTKHQQEETDGTTSTGTAEAEAEAEEGVKLKKRKSIWRGGGDAQKRTPQRQHQREETDGAASTTSTADAPSSTSGEEGANLKKRKSIWRGNLWNRHPAKAPDEVAAEPQN